MSDYRDISNDFRILRIQWEIKFKSTLLESNFITLHSIWEKGKF